MPETRRDERTTVDTETGGHDKFKHIVFEGVRIPGTDQETGETFVPAGNSVIEGFVNGTPVTALCGKTWVPNDNPAKYPLCPACKDIAREQWGKVFE
jgi:hypothetical protein